MPTCPNCGFDYSEPGDCPTCASHREGFRDPHAAPARRGLARIAAAFLRPTAPALIATALICGSAWLYARLPTDTLSGRDARMDAGRPTTALPAAGAVAASPSPELAPQVAAPATATAAAVAAQQAAKPRGAATVPASLAAPEAARVSASLPTNSKKDYIAWMLAHTNETRDFLDKKWNRAQSAMGIKDLYGEGPLQAFLYTPREYFARQFNIKKAYDNTAIPIGFGQTISGPHMVSHMTSAIAPERTDRILEIGTGSGYQSAVLSELSDHVFTIEIVSPLFQETDGIYKKLEKDYPEYGFITRKNADGYYGWPQYAPFQKIVVTAGIDHIPPPLLRQLAPNGIMVIPVGPPSGQTVLKIVKKPLPGGGFTFERSDLYGGRKVVFVPFTAQGGARHSLDDSSAGGGQ